MRIIQCTCLILSTGTDSEFQVDMKQEKSFIFHTNITIFNNFGFFMIKKSDVIM